MCGIGGIFDFSGREVERARLVRMADVMRHRGPDDEGCLIDGSFGMTMRRLSIIDLDSGRQPIFNEDRSVAVVFNGEIYNYRELREKLTASGHVFSTASDTEVIVHLYEEFGEGLAERINGMFAVSLWDSRTRRLLLFRDRLGIKPLYYTCNEQEFVFGSEMKCIAAACELSRNIDRVALDFYLRTQYFPLDRTILQDVRKLRAGHFMEVGPDGASAPRRYWEVRFSGTGPSSKKEAVDGFRSHFMKAVERQLVSDVPLGVFLSGGIDSAAVAAAMTRITGGPIQSFTIGFGDEAPGFSELEPARFVAEHLGAKFHHKVVQASDVAESMDRVLGHFDEPFGGGLHTFLVSALTAGHVKVALTGIGADELMGGYDRSRRSRALDLYRLLPGAARGAVNSIAGAAYRSESARPLAEKVLKLHRLSAAKLPELYFEWISVFDESMRRDAYAPGFFEESRVMSPGAGALEAFGNDMPEHMADMVSFLELKTTLADDFLNYTDKMTMAWSLEARVPFLDHELVEYTASLPESTRLMEGGTKQLLRLAVEDMLPRESLMRRKQPFLLPLGVWLRGPLRSMLEGSLMKGDLACSEFINPTAAKRMAAEHIDGRADFTWQLWSMMLLEKWCEKYL